MRRQPDRDKAAHAKARNARRRPLRLVLEPLEARRLLAGLNVSVLVDQDGSRSPGVADAPAAQRVVYLDLNNNGQQDSSDPVTFTDEHGIASFEGLIAGDYGVGIAGGNAVQKQSFPIRVDEMATTLGPAAKSLIASGDLAQVWAFDAAGQGRLLTAADPTMVSTVHVGGAIATSVNVGNDAWLITDSVGAAGRTRLTHFDTSSGRQTSKEIRGLAGREVDKLVKAGSLVIAQLSGPQGIELAELSLVEGVPTVGSSTAFPNLVSIEGGTDQQLAILEKSSSARTNQTQPTTVQLSVLSAGDFSRTATTSLPQFAEEIAFSSDGSLVLVAFSVGGVMVLNNDVQLSAIANLAEATAPLLTQSRDGRLVTGNSHDSAEFIVWDTALWQPTGRTRMSPNSTADQAVLAKSGDRLIATGTGGTVIAHLAQATQASVMVPHDGTASVQLGVQVHGSNRAPDASPISSPLLEDTVARGQLRSQVGDFNNDTLWFRVLTSPSSGRLELSPTGQWSYQPANNFNGVDRATVRVFDGQEVSDLALVLNVAPVNDPPEELRVVLSTATENAVASDTAESLGYVTVVDSDIESHYRFRASDQRFEVRNGQVYLAPGAKLDFESEPSIELEIVATEDSVSGYQISTTATLSIADVNEPPTAVKILNASILENSPGATVGEIQVADPDGNENFEFVVSDARFMIEGGYLKLRPGVALDFESADTVNLSVTVSDASGHKIEQTLSVDVADQNDAPSGIRVQLRTLEERTPGAVIGAIAVDDQDGQAYEYSLSDQRFEVVDGFLKLKDEQTVDKAIDESLTLTVTATSLTGSDSISSTVAVSVGARKSPYQNPVEPRDVNGDGEITPLDALILINYMNSFGPGPLGGSGGRGGSGEGRVWVDVNGDGIISPLDILIIINWLNRRRLIAIPTAAEGEADDPMLSGQISLSPANLNSSPLVPPLLTNSLEVISARFKSSSDVRANDLAGFTCPAFETRVDSHIDEELETLLEQLTLEQLSNHG